MQYSVLVNLGVTTKLCIFIFYFFYSTTIGRFLISKVLRINIFYDCIMQVDIYAFQKFTRLREFCQLTFCLRTYFVLKMFKVHNKIDICQNDWNFNDHEFKIVLSTCELDAYYLSGHCLLLLPAFPLLRQQTTQLNLNQAKIYNKFFCSIINNYLLLL